MRRFLAGLGLGLTLLSQGVSAEKLLPGDTTDRAPKYAAFRSLLLDAISKKDANFFRTRSQGAKVSFGLPTTLDEQFNLDDPNDRFWKIVSRMVNLGGTYQDGTREDPAGYVQYPYVSTRFPEKYDPFTHVAVVGREVNVRAEPSPDSKVVGTVSYEILEQLDHGQDWRQVKVSDKVTGYINSEYVYGPTDYRMILSNAKGRWMIELFIEGD